MGRSLAFNLIKWLIRLQFPSIKRMTTGELAQRLEAATPAPIILDARGQEEYAVSHLKDAQRVPVEAPDLLASALSNLAKDAPIVVYCSVGYRSAKVAQQLERAGFRQVFNLEGGLFEWADQGRSMLKEGQATAQVHPYNATWGKLLNDRHSNKDIEQPL